MLLRCHSISPTTLKLMRRILRKHSNWRDHKYKLLFVASFIFLYNDWIVCISRTCFWYLVIQIKQKLEQQVPTTNDNICVCHGDREILVRKIQILKENLEHDVPTKCLTWILNILTVFWLTVSQVVLVCCFLLFWFV